MNGARNPRGAAGGREIASCGPVDTFGTYLDSQERELLRRAITEEAFALARRLGLTGEEASIIATRMIRAAEDWRYPEVVS